ncbi:hypothetical protein BJX99DRAFT_260642 [Aspergillus californicus]
MTMAMKHLMKIYQYLDEHNQSAAAKRIAKLNSEIFEELHAALANIPQHMRVIDSNADECGRPLVTNHTPVRGHFEQQAATALMSQVDRISTNNESSIMFHGPIAPPSAPFRAMPSASQSAPLRAPFSGTSSAPLGGPLRAPLRAPYSVLSSAPISGLLDTPQSAPQSAPLRALFNGSSSAPLRAPFSGPSNAPIGVPIRALPGDPLRAPPSAYQGAPPRPPPSASPSAPQSDPYRESFGGPLRAHLRAPSSAPTSAPLTASGHAPKIVTPPASAVGQTINWAQVASSGNGLGPGMNGPTQIVPTSQTMTPMPLTSGSNSNIQSSHSGLGLTSSATLEETFHEKSGTIRIYGNMLSDAISHFTSLIHEGPLHEIHIESDSRARIIFQHALDARAFMESHQATLSLNGAGRFGQDYRRVELAEVANWTDDIRRMNQPTRERRRLSFAKKGLFCDFHVEKWRHEMRSLAGGPANVEELWVFNSGNATAIFTSTVTARKVLNAIERSIREGRQTYVDVSVTFSSDPCEKDLVLRHSNTFSGRYPNNHRHNRRGGR